MKGISDLEESSNRRNISIEDLKNINRTLMRSDFQHSNNSDEDEFMADQEIDNNTFGEEFCQMELRGKLSSISTIEDLSNKVKSKMERASQQEQKQITSSQVGTKILVTFQIKIKSSALKHN